MQNETEELQKINLTPEIKDRIKALKKEHDCTNAILDGVIAESGTTFNNLIKQSSPKTVKTQTLKLLARHFNCSYKYIICETDDPSLPSNQVISFEEYEKWFRNVADYLRSSDGLSLLRALNYTLTKIDSTQCSSLINGFVALIDVLRDNTFDSTLLPHSKVVELTQAFRYDLVPCEKALFRIADAKTYLQKKRYKCAIETLLLVIRDFSDLTQNQCNDAIKLLANIYQKKRSSFPKSLPDLTNKLDEQQRCHFDTNMSQIQAEIDNYLRTKYYSEILDQLSSDHTFSYFNFNEDIDSLLCVEKTLSPLVDIKIYRAQNFTRPTEPQIVTGISQIKKEDSSLWLLTDDSLIIVRINQFNNKLVFDTIPNGHSFYRYKMTYFNKLRDSLTFTALTSSH